MSISYSGTFTRSGGPLSAIAKQLRSFTLKPVKKIQVQFDPFHANAKTARDFLAVVTGPTITGTNLNCIIRTNVVCDRSEPEIKIDLLDTRSVKFLANNLTLVEILQQFNKHISSLVPAEEPDLGKKGVAETKKVKRIKQGKK